MTYALFTGIHIKTNMPLIRIPDLKSAPIQNRDEYWRFGLLGSAGGPFDLLLGSFVRRWARGAGA